MNKFIFSFFILFFVFGLVLPAFAATDLPDNIIAEQYNEEIISRIKSLNRNDKVKKGYLNLVRKYYSFNTAEQLYVIEKDIPEKDKLKLKHLLKYVIKFKRPILYYSELDYVNDVKLDRKTNTEKLYEKFSGIESDLINKYRITPEKSGKIPGELPVQGFDAVSTSLLPEERDFVLELYELDSINNVYRLRSEILPEHKLALIDIFEKLGYEFYNTLVYMTGTFQNDAVSLTFFLPQGWDFLMLESRIKGRFSNDMLNELQTLGEEHIYGPDRSSDVPDPAGLKMYHFMDEFVRIRRGEMYTIDRLKLAKIMGEIYTNYLLQEQGHGVIKKIIAAHKNSWQQKEAEKALAHVTPELEKTSVIFALIRNRLRALLGLDDLGLKYFFKLDRDICERVSGITDNHLVLVSFDGRNKDGYLARDEHIDGIIEDRYFGYLKEHPDIVKSLIKEVQNNNARQFYTSLIDNKSGKSILFRDLKLMELGLHTLLDTGMSLDAKMGIFNSLSEGVKPMSSIEKQIARVMGHMYFNFLYEHRYSKNTLDVMIDQLDEFKRNHIKRLLKSSLMTGCIENEIIRTLSLEHKGLSIFNSLTAHEKELIERMGEYYFLMFGYNRRYVGRSDAALTILKTINNRWVNESEYLNANIHNAGMVILSGHSHGGTGIYGAVGNQYKRIKEHILIDEIHSYGTMYRPDYQLRNESPVDRIYHYNSIFDSVVSFARPTGELIAEFFRSVFFLSPFQLVIWIKGPLMERRFDKYFNNNIYCLNLSPATVFHCHQFDPYAYSIHQKRGDGYISLLGAYAAMWARFNSDDIDKRYRLDYKGKF